MPARYLVQINGQSFVRQGLPAAVAGPGLRGVTVKFNSHHDERGRFASGPGGASEWEPETYGEERIDSATGERWNTYTSDPSLYHPTVREAYEGLPSAAREMVPPPAVKDGDMGQYVFGRMELAHEENPVRVTNVFEHEFAHYLDGETGLSASEGFQKAFADAKANVPSDAQPIKPKSPKIGAAIAAEQRNYITTALTAGKVHLGGHLASYYSEGTRHDQKEVFAIAFNAYSHYNPGLFKSYPSLFDYMDRTFGESASGKSAALTGPGLHEVAVGNAEASMQGVKVETLPPPGAPDPRDEAERRLMAALAALFEKLLPDIAAHLAQGEMPGDAELANAFAVVLQPQLAEIAAEEFERLGVQVGVQFDPAIVNQQMVEWARTYTFDLVKNITETTRKTLQSAVEQFASTPGMTRGQLEALIEPAFGKDRAEAIAITEVTRASAAAIEQYQTDLTGAGIEMERIYHTSHDELVCPLCVPSNGKPEGEWEGKGPPPRHVRCRCFCTLRVKRN